MSERLGDAHSQYDNFVGTGAADDHGGSEIYDFFGIDQDTYWVLALHLSNLEGMEFLSAYAVHREIASGYEELQSYAATHDREIPVIEFPAPDGFTLHAFLNRALKRFDVMLQLRSQVVEQGLVLVPRED